MGFSLEKDLAKLVHLPGDVPTHFSFILLAISGQEREQTIH